MTRLSRIGALVAALTLAIVGCGGDSSSEGASSRCEPLPSAAAEHLGFALSSGTRLVDPVAVRSDEFEHVYMVAARVDGQPAVWAMNQLGGFGLIISVNDHAYDVSRMGRGEDLRDPITEDTDGVAEALSCVSAS